RARGRATPTRSRRSASVETSGCRARRRCPRARRSPRAAPAALRPPRPTRRAARRTPRAARRGRPARAPTSSRREGSLRVMDDEVTNQVYEAAPYTKFLGLEIVSASADEVRSRLAWSADKCTAGGMLHGGALMGLADSAGGFLACINLPADAQAPATIEPKTHLPGPIPGRYG